MNIPEGFTLIATHACGSQVTITYYEQDNWVWGDDPIADGEHNEPVNTLTLTCTPCDVTVDLEPERSDF